MHIGDDANFPVHCYSDHFSRFPANQQPTVARAATIIHSNGYNPTDERQDCYEGGPIGIPAARPSYAECSVSNLHSDNLDSTK